MRISVILSTYNQPEWLRKSLTGFLHQDICPHEIVIADDGSGDETRAVVDQFSKVAPFPLEHVWHEDSGFRKTRILNLAIAAATGDYLVFSDGDCIPRRDYLDTHSRFARQGAFLSGGLVRLRMSTSQIIEPRHIRTGECFRPGWIVRHGGLRPARLLKLSARGWLAAGCNRLTHVPPNWSGSNASCWRQDALAVGGFDERMQYWREDFEFGQRLMHLGVKPRQVRYSAITLHLDHARGYVSQEMMDRNEEILAQTRSSGKVTTEYGLCPAA